MINGNSEMIPTQNYDFVKRDEFLQITDKVEMLLIENGRKDTALENLIAVVTTMSNDLKSMSDSVRDISAHDKIRVTLIKWCVLTCGGAILSVICGHFADIIKFLYHQVS